MIMADAGENQKKLEEVLERAAKQAEEAGAKSSTESFNGLTLHVVRRPRKRPRKTTRKRTRTRPPRVRPWSGPMRAASSLSVATSTSSRTWRPIARDATIRWPATESFTKTQAKIDAQERQAVWYLDVAKVVKAGDQGQLQEGDAQAQQTDVLATELGSMASNRSAARSAWDRETTIV